MLSVQPYVNFPGNCREAVEFYAKAFGVPLQQIMTFGDGPENPSFPLPPEAKSLVMHTFLVIAGTQIMFSDTFPGMSLQTGDNISLTVVSPDADDLKRWFTALSEGGRVQMELQETFWTKCYGMVTDKFGIPWQVSQEA